MLIKTVAHNVPVQKLGNLKGVFHGSAHVQAYQLYPSQKPHSYVLLVTHTINSPRKTTNDENSQQLSTEYTENVDIEYRKKLPE